MVNKLKYPGRPELVNGTSANYPSGLIPCSWAKPMEYGTCFDVNETDDLVEVPYPQGYIDGQSGNVLVLNANEKQPYKFYRREPYCVCFNKCVELSLFISDRCCWSWRLVCWIFKWDACSARHQLSCFSLLGSVLTHTTMLQML